MNWRAFVSLTGYVIIAAAVFLMGLSFVDLLLLLQGESTPRPSPNFFIRPSTFWLILLLADSRHYHAALAHREGFRNLQRP